LTDNTIKNNIAFGIENENIDDNKINNAIKLAQLENYISNLENGIDTIVGERGVKISGGERQRIGIARALYNNPPILILDEATSSLDIKTESEFMLAINNLHKLKTIVIIAHRLSTIEKCDVVYEVKNTEILLKNL
jgi:ABC-type multidrug transport system fused ATPase/permease subunit